ncbi:MAG: hypothetical protein KGY74_07150 [Candidatus Cloacimonetes bacterium]|nr:hypothetical protein [Candidatus Cloacimonadota bacterium]
MAKNRMTFLIFILFLSMTLISCLKKNEQEVIRYTITDSVDLDISESYINLEKTENGFIGLNWNKRRVEFISNEGKLISFYGKEGNGPGEFNNPFVMDFYKNFVHVGDTSRGKIIICKLHPVTQQISYHTEFMAEGGMWGIAIMNNENIFITRPGIKKNLALFNAAGEVKSNFIATKLDKFDTRENLLNSVCSIKIAGKNICLFYIHQKKLVFYRFSDGQLTKIKEINNKNFNKPLETDGSNFYIGYSITDTTYSNYKVYNKVGEFEGDILLQEHFYCITFSKNSSIWGLKPEKYDYIYLAEP